MLFALCDTLQIELINDFAGNLEDDTFRDMFVSALRPMEDKLAHALDTLRLASRTSVSTLAETNTRFSVGKSRRMRCGVYAVGQYMPVAII